MKPPDFEYCRPVDLGDALERMVAYGEDVKVLAGGQSLVPMMNFRLSRPSALVDIARIPELVGIRRDNETLVTGAMTRQWDAEHHRDVAAACPILVEALGLVGHTAIRARGTVGGSLAHADPAAELPITAVALGAEMVIASGTAGQTRVVPADEFFVHYYTTALTEHDLLTEIRWPVMRDGQGAALVEFALRHGDFAVVAVAAMVTMKGSECRDVRISLGGVAATPVRALEAERALEGSPPDDDSLAAAAELASQGVDPSSDITAPEGYRRHLVRELTQQALRTAVTRANENQGRPDRGR